MLKWILACALPLCLNGCVWLVAGGAEGGYIASKDQSAGQTLRDQAITAGIKTKLIGSEIAARNVNVDTDGGVVTLRGTVKSRKQLSMAVKIARTTKGVKKVISKLEILPE